jgi:hypothetical protein
MKDHKPRGFAAMTPERRRFVASLGGRASQAQGTAYHWTRDEAKIAGAKGGARSRDRRRGHTKGGA